MNWKVDEAIIYNAAHRLKGGKHERSVKSHKG